MTGFSAVVVHTGFPLLLGLVEVSFLPPLRAGWWGPDLLFAWVFAAAFAGDGPRTARAAFACGLLKDLLHGYPPGLHALLYLLAAHPLHRAKKAFRVDHPLFLPAFVLLLRPLAVGALFAATASSLRLSGFAGEAFLRTAPTAAAALLLLPLAAPLFRERRVVFSAGAGGAFDEEP